VRLFTPSDACFGCLPTCLLLLQLPIRECFRMASMLVNPLLDQVQANSFPSGSCSSSASSSRSSSPAFGLTADYESITIVPSRAHSLPVLLPSAPALADTRHSRSRSHCKSSRRRHSLTSSVSPVAAMAALANLNLAAHGVLASQVEAGLPRPPLEQISPKVSSTRMLIPWLPCTGS
jgi:hypothetical protein